MVEIWTEDSGAGYIITRGMIKTYYGSQYIMIKPHDGNGDSKPDQSIKNSHGGLLYDLRRNRHNDNVIIILIDMAVDNLAVQVEIEKIRNELKLHSNRHRLIGLYCFEYGMLSYKNLYNYGGVENLVTKKDISIFFSAFNNGMFNCKSLINKGFSMYKSLNELQGKTGEQISKVLLSKATNKYNLRLRKKNIQGAIIHGDRVGPCWTCNCCKYEASATYKYCDKTIQEKLNTLDNKMLHLINNSKFSIYIDYINKLIQKIVDTTYSGNIASDVECNSRQYIINKMNKNQLIGLQLRILEYAQMNNNQWNWARIYNLLQEESK